MFRKTEPTQSRKIRRPLELSLQPTKEMFRCCAFLAVCFISSINGEGCERLKSSLTYTQENAPRGMTNVLPIVNNKINEVLQGVVSVEVKWEGGDLRRVGMHDVICIVRRLADSVANPKESFLDDYGNHVTEQCFAVPFEILDINECTLPKGHEMRHACHASAQCANTIGSYECVCPRMDEHSPGIETANESYWSSLASQNRGPWEVALQTSSFCPGLPSTHGCCPAFMTEGEASECRAGFRCPLDPCRSHTCSSKATCTRNPQPPGYECPCPAPLMGNGHKCIPGKDPKPEPMYKYDGVTPTERTVKYNFFCDCTLPVVDACDGFQPCEGKHEECTVGRDRQPACTCKKGYVKHEKYGCVDESPPVLRLKNDPKGDQIMRLRQGDVYHEYGVEIQDENSEEYSRSLRIVYSTPYPRDCLYKIGSFHVDYSVDTPWTVPPYVKITRQVIIEDIDECTLDMHKYEKTCPILVHKCDTDAGATCQNTNGSYTCKCPKYTAGDGFLKGMSFKEDETPVGFKGGQSCHDVGKPVISLQGPNPKVFRVCECSGLSGIMSKKEGPRDGEMKQNQQLHYESEIMSMIKSTKGAELCASHGQPNPNPADCVKAYDDTYSGRVNLSKKVVVGEPTRKSPTRWSVPYNVEDEFGNAAVTVYRDVVVEEVGIDDLQAKIHAEYAQREKELRAELENLKKEPRNRRTANCPACPPCDCSAKFNEKTCGDFCRSQKPESCPNPPRVPPRNLEPQLQFDYSTYNIPQLQSPIGMLAAIGVVVSLFFCMCYRGPSTHSYEAPPPPRPASHFDHHHHHSNGMPTTNGIATFTSPQAQQQRRFGTSPGEPNNRGADLFSSANDADLIYRSPRGVKSSIDGSGVRDRSETGRPYYDFGRFEE